MRVEWTNRDNLSIETTGRNGKAVLVIDMPDTCEECQLRDYNQCYGLEFDRTLIEKWDGEDKFKTRNKICPLRPLPQKIDDEDNDLTITAGWNECIDEILGEK